MRIRHANLLPAAVLFGALIAAPVWADWPVNGAGFCPGPTRQYTPSSTSNGYGGSIVVWTDGTDGSTSIIYAQNITWAGAFNSFWPPCGTAVGYGNDTRNNSRTVSDGAGGAIIAWEDARSNATSGQDIYAGRVKQDGTIASGWTPGGVAVCSAVGNQMFA